MSIYATLWSLQFPRYGDDYIGCEWIKVTAQGVPAHIGTPTPGFGYEKGDPYAEFLPPPLEVNEDGDNELMRAVVIITEQTQKGTARSPQESCNPFLILFGRDFALILFTGLQAKICDALRGDRPAVVAQSFTPEG